MKTGAVSQWLVFAASVQAQAFSSLVASRTTVDNLEPTATDVEIVTGPINTGTACSKISVWADESPDEYPVVDAELAFACLKSVPIDDDAASGTIAAIKQMLQLQSTVSYLKEPPSSYPNEGVDLSGGLDDIGRNVSNGGYDNEYDFENDIAALINKAHDGHFQFDGMAFGGVFRWRRSRELVLTSFSSNGEIPKVWALKDINGTTDYKASAISTINGQNAIEFLQQESNTNAYQDPDTRFNSMLLQSAATSNGYFVNPPFYPGPTTDVTYENGTTRQFRNTALVLDYKAWGTVSDPKSFYDTFIAVPITSGDSDQTGSATKVPHNVPLPKDKDFSATVPETYPDPVVQHPGEAVPLAGYFFQQGTTTTGVLVIQTFNVDTVEEAEGFQNVIQEYIAEAKRRNVTKHIIDVRTNGGGLVMLGIDTYKQFFPSQEPQMLSRYRSNDATNLLGSRFSTLGFTSATSIFYLSPFNERSYVNQELEDFADWDDMSGPNTFNGDTFTDLLRYNLSDSLVSSDDRFSVGITITGYGDRSQFRDDPFSADDIVILSDGICASTCNLFVELMVQQSGVKTIAVGGRPQLGPMQPVGGTKGSLILSASQLATYAGYLIASFGQSTAQATSWAAELPFASYTGINFFEASVNLQDSIRWGLEKDGYPTQFLNDTASCRLWYEQQDWTNVTALWERTGEVAFGKNGGLDEARCVAGSASSREAQTGQGDGSPSSPQGGEVKSDDSDKGDKSGAASRLLDSTWWAAYALCACATVFSMI